MQSIHGIILFQFQLIVSILYLASLSVFIQKHDKDQKMSGTSCYLMYIFVWGKVQMVETLLVSINRINEY